MADSYDLIVIGGGSVGLSTAWRAARRGRKTLVIEQFGFFNDQGSSAGASRQFRLQYAQQYMSELVIASQPFWANLQRTTQETLITQVGSIWFGDPAVSSQEGGIEAAETVMDTLGIPYEKLDAVAIESRFGFRELPADYAGFFQASGGIIDLKGTDRAMYEAADRSGLVTFRGWEAVTSVTPAAKGPLTVTTDRGSYCAAKLAITSGAYTNRVTHTLDAHVNLTIWEMSSAYYRKADPQTAYPTWFVFQKPQDTSLFYGFPEVDWSYPGYIRVAPDIPDRIITDPDQRSPAPSPKSLALNEEWVRVHMRGLDPVSQFTSTCLIALAGNDTKELLLDHAPGWVPGSENIVVYTAGWAAKFIPILGDMICRLLEGEIESFDYSGFSIPRSHFAIDWQKPAAAG